MDIAEFHGRMRDKYAEKQQLEHRLFSTYILKLIVFLARYFAACSETSMESGLQPYF